MKTAASYIKKKYDCYKGYSEKSIRDVCHMWCEVIEEAQNDVKKEYEEKLRWIPVEERLPKKMQTEPSVSKVVQVKSKNFSEPFCAFYNHLYGIWLPYPFGSNSQIVGITEWRSFL